MEREPQVPPIVKFTQATEEFAANKADKSSQFKITVSEIRRKFGGDENPKSQEIAQELVKQGVGMITHKVGMLQAFANPENRQQVIDNLKKEKITGAWIEILNNWNVQVDPYGINVLESCKQADIEELAAKAEEAKDPNEKKQILLQAEAIGKGQDLIINYYRSQIGSSTAQMAA